MGPRKGFKGWKKPAKRPGSDTTSDCSVQNPAPTEAEADSNSPAVAGQRMSRSFADPAGNTEPRSSTPTTAIRNATVNTDSIPAQVTPSPLENDTLSLWDRAYKALRVKETELVDQYENLLSQELGGNVTTDSDERQVQLKSIVDRGLSEADSKQIKRTMFGQEFVLKEQFKQASVLIQAIQCGRGHE